MKQPTFRELTVLSHDRESEAGCTELCRSADGTRQIRICIEKPELQRSVLTQLDERVPAQLEGRRLELLFPWQEGEDLETWIFYRKPGLSRRREMCLSLLAQFLTQPIPAELAVLSARPENLCFREEGAALQLVPELSIWQEEQGRAGMVRSAAALMAEILTRKLEKRVDQEYPEELELFLIRQESGAYADWEMLQRDLFRIPEEMKSKARELLTLKERILSRVRACVPAAVGIVTVLLVALALTSLYFAMQSRREAVREETDQWHGIQVIGQEQLTPYIIPEELPAEPPEEMPEEMPEELPEEIPEEDDAG